jgi:integrase/recombinase XerC
MQSPSLGGIPERTDPPIDTANTIQTYRAMISAATDLLGMVVGAIDNSSDFHEQLANLCAGESADALLPGSPNAIPHMVAPTSTAQFSAGSTENGAPMNLEHALKAYLAVARAPQTRETYASFLTRFVHAIGPGRPLDLVTPEDLDAFVSDMCLRRTKYADHPRRPTVNKPLSSATIYKNVKMIKSFFNWCVKRGYLTQSPSRFLVNSRPNLPLGRGKAATDQEFALMVAAARFRPREMAIVLLLGTSGCRAGELASLQIQDVDWDKCVAMVNGKGEKRREILFSRDARDAMQAWLAVRPPVDHDCVFCSRTTGEPLLARGVSQVIRRLCKTAGIRGLGAHSLRHRVGLIFARNHVAPRVAQSYLGHTNITITLNYYQDVDESDLRAAGQLLNSE